MAYPLLGTAIQKLGSFAQDELATILGVGEQNKTLSEKLTGIRARLGDAEEKQITSGFERHWLQRLTDVAHVLDDILEEYSIKLKAHEDDNVIITHLNPMKNWARRHFAKRMKKIAKKIDDIYRESTVFRSHPETIEPHDEWRQTTSVITEPKIYGRDKDREQVVEFLQNASDSEELSVYSIVGVGGLGKTTLAQQVFNDERVSSSIHFDLKIWVCVGVDFSIMKILRSIVESTIGKNPDLFSLEAMQKKVQEILQSKKYLLVLDDVWNADEEKWNTLKNLLPHGKGASVLVTTRLQNVASIMGTRPAHYLERLSDDDIWSLFRQHAFGPNEEERAELVAIGKEIVRKCVGSPLAAKVLGSFLRGETEEHQWLSIMESEFWNSSEDNRIMSALRLSYLNLKLSLRPCFSFCAVFPKDVEMAKEQLIHLWMANGFISSRGNLAVELVGNKVWNELYQRSFFQEVKTDEKGSITFKMHDLLHDLAQSIMGEECVSSKAASLTNLSSRVHHIGCFDFDEGFDYEMNHFKKVESLRTFLELDSSRQNFGVFPSITSLRALRTSSFQLSSLKNLTHLRYLEIYNSGINTLPGSISKLQKLQILKLKSCDYLSSLPEQLTELHDLRHLVIKNCKSLVSMPSKIGELTCLKTLSIYIVGSKERSGLAELHDLQLGGKLHIRGLENVQNEGDAREGEANLTGKKELNCLYLTWGSYANSQSSGTNSQSNGTIAEQVLQALEPHSGLKSFGTKGYGGTRFPDWMRNTSIMNALVDVILYDCKNCEQLPPLGKLPCLKTLFVSGMINVKYIDEDSYNPPTEKAFVSLEKLTLRDIPNLERMLEAEGVEMLPRLSFLCISGVPKLTLPSLPSVEILYASEGNGKSLASNLGGIVSKMDNLKILHIRDFNKLKVLPDELNSLSSLEEFRISSCEDLESFSEHVLHGLNSLRTLTIYSCRKLVSLSEGMGHLTCLERLDIFECPQLALASNMNRLTALREVEIGGVNEIGGLERIPSLQILTLVDFPSLTSLPEWLGAKTSLQKLKIIRCPEIRLQPDSFQQLENLHELYIHGCPELEKQCKKRSGKHRQKKDHEPKLEIVAEPTLFENMKFAWKMRKQLWHNRRTLNRSQDEFDRMVDDF